MKRTPWYPAHKRSPDKVGEYEYRYTRLSKPIRMWWDGALWRNEAGGQVMTPWYQDHWRGLAEPCSDG